MVHAARVPPKIIRLFAVVAALATYGWVGEGAVAVVERAAASNPVTWPDGWRPWPERVYGDTLLELAEFD